MSNINPKKTNRKDKSSSNILRGDNVTSCSRNTDLYFFVPFSMCGVPYKSIPR